MEPVFRFTVQPNEGSDYSVGICFIKQEQIIRYFPSAVILVTEY